LYCIEKRPKMNTSAYEISSLRQEEIYEAAILLHYLWGGHPETNVRYLEWKYFDNPYSKMYIKGRLSVADHKAWTRTVENAFSIAHRVSSMTQGATLYYSPMSMRPKGSAPKWNFKLLTEVFVPGVDPNHIRMYKNK